MKSFNNLSDKEIIDIALTAVPDYLATIRFSGEFNVAACLRKEISTLERTFKNQNFDKYLPELRERTIAIQTKYLQGRKVSKINFTTAEAIILDACGKRGLPTTVHGQRYRAKVETAIPYGAKVRYYVRYRDLAKEGLMDDVIKALLDMSDALTRLGYGVVLRRG